MSSMHFSGITLTTGVCKIKKDDKTTRIGISIGGGAPTCPCVYIVQVFDNTAASKDGTLAAGDEILSVNGESVKGMTKTQVAKFIQACEVRDLENRCSKDQHRCLV